MSEWDLELTYEGELPEIDGKALLKEIEEKKPEQFAPKTTVLDTIEAYKIIDTETGIVYNIKSGKIPTREVILFHDITGTFVTLEPVDGGEQIFVQLGFSKEGELNGRYKLA